jgi:hypothetical protein
MPKAIVEGSTFLKKRPLAAQDLANFEKIFMPKGREFFVTRSAPASNQHVYLRLASPLTMMDGKTKIQDVYAYDPHIRIEQTQPGIKLAVPYRAQGDNDPSIFGSGQRQCNISSNTMLADYLLKGALTKLARDRGLPEAESVYMRLVAKYGDTIDHTAHTRALKELKIESYFSYTLSAKDVLSSLMKGIPVVVGFAYRSSGHICVVVGHDPNRRVWLVHDPYGIRYGSSDAYDIGVNGAYDHYSYEVFQQIFLDQGNSESGWGRIVTSVAGKPTGLPQGL